MKKYLILLIILTSAFVFSNDINLNHLNFLKDNFKINGNNYTGYWIYADKNGNSYVHKDASGEGVTCVDDVARVAVLYTDLYKENQEISYRENAKESLDFVLAMQDSDGDFYNFIYNSGEINTLGITSRKSASWWTARAFWAVSNSIFMFEGDYRNKLLSSAKKAESVLSRQLDKNGLINGYSDVSSVYLLGLTEFYNITGDTDILKTAQKIADGLISKQMQSGLFTGAYNESKSDFLWHSWGSRQAEALIQLYKITGEEKYIDSVKLYADNVFNLVLSVGPLYEAGEYIKLYEQIAYGSETYISAASKLYEITKEEKYAYYTVFLYSFFEGNNIPNIKMYGKNGEGFDGLHSIYANKNSGAESTISYIISQIRLKKIPEKYLQYKDVIFSGYSGVKIMEAEKMNSGIYSFSLDTSNNVRIETNSKIVLKNIFENKLTGIYNIYISGNSENKTSVKIYSGSEKSDYLINPGKGFISAGKINTDSEKFTVSLDPEGKLYIDQIILVPENYIFVFEKNGNQYYFDGESVKPGNFEINIKKSESITYNVNSEDSGIIDISSVNNNNGIVGYSQRKDGNFDNPEGIIGASYSYDALKEKTDNFSVSYDGALLKFYPGEKDNFVAASQILNLNIPINGNNLYIAGSSDHGSYTSKIITEYTDGTTQENTIGFSDWCQSPQYGEDILIQFEYRYNNLGIQENIGPKIFVNKIKLIHSEKISKIYFTSQPTMHIFALTIK